MKAIINWIGRIKERIEKMDASEILAMYIKFALVIVTTYHPLKYINSEAAKDISVLLEGTYFTDFNELNSYIAEH